MWPVAECAVGVASKLSSSFDAVGGLLMLIPLTAACRRATGSFSTALPEAIASSIDLIGAGELLPPPLRDTISAVRAEGEEALVGDGGDAKGLVTPIPRGRILIPGT